MVALASSSNSWEVGLLSGPVCSYFHVGCNIIKVSLLFRLWGNKRNPHSLSGVHWGVCVCARSVA